MPDTDPLAPEPAHDVLAAEAFAVPAPDPALRNEPVVLPEDPSGISEPHDVLAAEEFAMPAGRPARARGRTPTTGRPPSRTRFPAPARPPRSTPSMRPRDRCKRPMESPGGRTQHCGRRSPRPPPCLRVRPCGRAWAPG